MSIFALSQVDEHMPEDGGTDNELKFGRVTRDTRPTRNMYEIECANCNVTIGREGQSYRVDWYGYDGMGTPADDASAQLCEECFPDEVLG